MHMAFSNNYSPREMPLRNCAHINNETYTTTYIVAQFVITVELETISNVHQ